MNLERAIATVAHAGQTDKAVAPYISHPLRVMRAQESDEACPRSVKKCERTA